MKKISEWIIKNHGLVLAVSLVVLILSIIVASRLEILSNMEHMLPSDSEAIKAGTEFDRYFESQETAMVVVRGESALCESFLEDLEKKITDAGIKGKVLYRINREEIKEFALLYLDREFYEKLDAALDAKDPDAVAMLLAGIEGEETAGADYEYLSNDKKDAYMMVIKPFIDKADFVGSRQVFYDGVKNAVQSTLAAPGYSGLSGGLTGGAFIQDIEADSAAFDGFSSTFAVTLLLIILLVVFSFKRILLPLSIAYPLLLGTCAAAAVAWLIYGSLNMFSVSFALLMIGLGIDFAIHLISRYYEERGKQRSVPDAAGTALRETGMGILIGVLTTAIAFASFAVTRFKALEQMGIISSIGILVLCIIMLAVVPALMKLFDSGKRSSAPQKNEFTFLNGLGEGISKRPWIVILILAALIPVFYTNVSKTVIVGDIDKVYPENLESRKWESVLIESFDSNPNILTFMVDGEEELRECIDALAGQRGVVSVESALDYLPSEQNFKLDVLARMSALLTALGYPDAYEFNIGEMTVEDLPEAIRSNYIGKEGRLLAEVVPSVNVYQQDNYIMLRDAIFKASGHLPVGMPAVMNEIVGMVQKDIITISLICFASIIAFLMLAFRSLKATFICTIPVLLTIYLTLGILPVTGREINIFSIAAFPLIIGIGIDSSIHLMHRLRSGNGESIGSAVKHTGKAIILTSLTTLLGFGSLAFINHPGMSNLGLTVALGMLICLMVTLLLVPAAYRLTEKKKPK